MSYDYLMCRPLGGITPLPAFDEIDGFESLGSVDEVKAAISAVFTSVQWSAARSSDSNAWFGRMGPPEFQVSPEPDGTVTNFMMSHATPDDVSRLTASMRIVGMDLQQEIVVGA